MSASSLYELRDMDGIIEPFTMTGTEMLDYCNRCLKELRDNWYVMTTKEAIEVLEQEFRYKIKELF